MNNIKDFAKPILWIIGLLILAVFAFTVFMRQVGVKAHNFNTAETEPADENAIDESVQAVVTPTERSFRIVTLLPFDAIPAIDNPSFYSAAEADAEYEPGELVLGVTINGESKAYSTSHLDSHEIVNDTLGGRKIAVTW